MELKDRLPKLRRKFQAAGSRAARGNPAKKQDVDGG
jgi:hypothetical protein